MDFPGSLPAELLRVVSPSAEVQGHSPSERKLVPGKKDVTIKAIEPVGNYGVRLVFSDGHNTGIYSWVYLHEIARKKDELWNSYRDELAAAGLSPRPVSATDRAEIRPALQNCRSLSL